MAKFIKSASNLDIQCPNDDIVEFCFVGRSNVGKSSLINALANAKIAFTSKTPGRTQLINLYDFINYRIIDLPGYGYAKVSRDKKDDIENILETYITKRTNLFGVFQVCDLGVITEQDSKVSIYLNKRFVNHYVILNKADKVNKSYFENNKTKIAKLLQVPVEHLIVCSTKEKLNMALIKQTMNNLARSVK